MRSLVADERYGTSDDTARLPALPASFVPESPAGEASAAHDVGIAVLGPTLRFKGDLSAQEDFILWGRVEGSIQQAQRIFIAAGGAVVGTIHARAVVVDGTVQGDLHGLESVTVTRTGRVVGNIFAPRVVLIDGAVFNGRIDMSGGAAVGERNGKPDVNAVASQASSGTRADNPMKVVLVPPPPVRERVGAVAK